MPKMKNSYKQIRSVFPDTAYGKVSLELAVGQQSVLVIDDHGIKATLPVASLSADKQHRLVDACRESEPEKFQKFVTELEGIDA